ncbi:MAG: hypothetical protein IPN76_07060 [Saprospiraceae bacterium]|jgi:hypothetical protein|nr:hypothetical protein [Saprospiraceae bacterium]
MVYVNFKSSPTPPTDNPLLAALWHDAKGDWEAAHDIAQDIHTREGSWLHAYLHRKEGDQWNAGYWYRQAGKPVHTGTLEQEWEELVSVFSNTR